jgi:hypothetical protein
MRFISWKCPSAAAVLLAAQYVGSSSEAKQPEIQPPEIAVGSSLEIEGYDKLPEELKEAIPTGYAIGCFDFGGGDESVTRIYRPGHFEYALISCATGRPDLTQQMAFLFVHIDLTWKQVILADGDENGFFTTPFLFNTNVNVANGKIESTRGFGDCKSGGYRTRNHYEFNGGDYRLARIQRSSCPSAEWRTVYSSEN